MTSSQAYDWTHRLHDLAKTYCQWAACMEYNLAMAGGDVTAPRVQPAMAQAEQAWQAYEHARQEYRQAAGLED